MLRFQMLRFPAYTYVFERGVIVHDDTAIANYSTVKQQIRQKTVIHHAKTRIPQVQPLEERKLFETDAFAYNFDEAVTARDAFGSPDRPESHRPTRRTPYNRAMPA